MWFHGVASPEPDSTEQQAWPGSATLPLAFTVHDYVAWQSHISSIPAWLFPCLLNPVACSSAQGRSVGSVSFLLSLLHPPPLVWCPEFCSSSSPGPLDLSVACLWRLLLLPMALCLQTNGIPSSPLCPAWVQCPGLQQVQDDILYLGQ